MLPLHRVRSILRPCRSVACRTEVIGGFALAGLVAIAIALPLFGAMTAPIPSGGPPMRRVALWLSTLLPALFLAPSLWAGDAEQRNFAVSLDGSPAGEFKMTVQSAND